MTFLPIVERELRVAARRRSTFWLRLAAALTALVIGGGFLVLSLVASPVQNHLGSGLFSILTWLSLAVALGAGLFLTADCLSEEKREGTLGLLFLTDLRGCDVVLGKLLATSLRGGAAFLAVFPILAITILMGGVTGGQFWRAVLAIVNALFFSLAAGLFVSTFSRDSQKAMGGTLGLLVLVLLGGVAADHTLAAVQERPFEALWSLSSPGYVFTEASVTRGNFWPALAVNQCIAWVLLGVACWRAPGSWQERSAQVSSRWLRVGRWWRYGGAKLRARVRQKFLERNPALWLAARERWQAVAVWLLTTVVVVGFGIGLFAVSDWFEEVWFVMNMVGGFLAMILYLWTASHACRFFVDARRSGILELLLASPLNSRRIAEGSWQALARSFGPPVVLFLMVQLVTQTLSQSVMVGARRTLGTGSEISFAWLVAGSGLTVSATLANLIALVWFGLWMGLTTRSAAMATLKALLFVQIIPAMVISFVVSLAIPLLTLPALLRKGNVGATPGFALWMPLLMPVLAALLAIAKDLFFILWSRRQLFGDLRERTLQAGTQVRLPPVPPVITRAVP